MKSLQWWGMSWGPILQATLRDSIWVQIMHQASSENIRNITPSSFFSVHLSSHSTAGSRMIGWKQFKNKYMPMEPRFQDLY